MLLHDAQKLDDDLGRRPDQDLPLARLLGVVDGIQGVVENGSLDHFDRGCGLLQLSKKFASIGQSFGAAILSVRLSFLRRTAEKR